MNCIQLCIYKFFVKSRISIFLFLFLFIILLCYETYPENIMSQTSQQGNQNININTTIDFYLESADCHPKPYCGDLKNYRAIIGTHINDRRFPIFKMENQQIALKGFKKEKFISICVCQEPLMLKKQLQPEGRLATLVFTEHPDGSTIDSIKALYFGTNNVKSPEYKKKGFLGHGLKTSRAEFFLTGATSNGFTIYVINPKSGEIVKSGDFNSFSSDLSEFEQKEEVKKLYNFVKQIPQQYYAAVVLSDNFPFQIRNTVFKAMMMLGGEKILNIQAFDSYCMLGRSRAKIGSVPEVLVPSRKREDINTPRNAEIKTTLNNPPITVHLISSGKYDNADVGIFIFKNGKLLSPPNTKISNKFTGLINNSERRKTIKSLYKNDIIIGPHTISPMNDYECFDFGIKFFKKKYKSEFWIDHGFNFEDLVRYGYKKESPYYILNKLENAGYRYAWNWWDMGYYIPNAAEIKNEDYPFNMMYAQKNNSLPILFYTTNRMDDDLNDDKIITLYNAYPHSYINNNPNAYNNKLIDQLILERGVHISHSYFTNAKGKYLIIDDNETKINPEFDDSLKYISEKVKDMSIWNPDVVSCGDYQKLISNIELIHLGSNKILVKNNNNEKVKGLTFSLSNFKINEILINGHKIKKNFRYINDDLLFWIDLKSRENVVIEAAKLSKIENVKDITIEKKDNEILVINEFYNAKINEKGLLFVYSKNNDLLFKSENFSAIYDFGTITINTNPEITISEENAKKIVKCSYKSLNYITMEIIYIFYSKSGNINISFNIEYLCDLKIEAEKWEITITQKRNKLLNHAHTWSTEAGKFTYPIWYPPFAEFGEKENSVYLYGAGNMIKTEIK